MNTRVVIGIGCEDHGDQIAALLAVRAVRRAGAVVEVVESSGAPSEVIAAWRGARSAVVVEVMPGDVPGVIGRCRPHPRDPAFGCGSTQVSPRLREALAMGPLPAEVTIVTIAARCFVAGAPATPAVVAAADEVAAAIVADHPAHLRRRPPVARAAAAPARVPVGAGR